MSNNHDCLATSHRSRSHCLLDLGEDVGKQRLGARGLLQFVAPSDIPSSPGRARSIFRT
jgi:hypothetical protein